MKILKKIGILILTCIILYSLSYVINLAMFIVKIDNTDFGFPLWLDTVIDMVAGFIAYLFVKTLFGLSKNDKEKIKEIVAIVIGLLIGVMVHVLLKYWIIILIIIGVLVVSIIVINIIKSKNKKKEKTMEKN